MAGGEPAVGVAFVAVVSAPYVPGDVETGAGGSGVEQALNRTRSRIATRVIRTLWTFRRPGILGDGGAMSRATHAGARLHPLLDPTAEGWLSHRGIPGGWAQ